MRVMICRSFLASVASSNIRFGSLDSVVPHELCTKRPGVKPGPTGADLSAMHIRPRVPKWEWELVADGAGYRSGTFWGCGGWGLLWRIKLLNGSAG